MNIELMMKAVNDLKGDLENGESTSKYWQDLGFKFLREAYCSTSSDDVFALTKSDSEDTICSIHAFNELVIELSNWQSTLPKVEVVEVDGMVYEIGKIYEFSDGDEYPWITSRLVKADADHAYKFESQEGAWNYIRACKSNIGTITPATVKLVDGDAYLINTKLGNRYCGFYSISGDRFIITPDGMHVLASDCTNITRLVPEVK